VKTADARPFERRSRIVLLALALVTAGLGAWGTFLPPRITLSNTALRIDHPWPVPAGWAAIAAAALLVAFAVRSRLGRIALGLVAVVLLVQAWHVAVYRLEAGATLLEEKQALASLSIPWNQVRQVDSRALEIAVWGPESQILIDTGRFTPEQRATVDRTIARHLREH
jgi:hypothetical protein